MPASPNGSNEKTVDMFLIKMNRSNLIQDQAVLLLGILSDIDTNVGIIKNFLYFVFIRAVIKRIALSDTDIDQNCEAFSIHYQHKLDKTKIGKRILSYSLKITLLLTAPFCTFTTQ